MSTPRRWLPDAESVRSNRWLRWLGPALHHPRLWHVSRRGLALGMALGVFFGLLIPLAQIPVSAAAAVASTLVTNPLTFGPVYYAAWRLGSAILGESEPQPPAVATVPEGEPPDENWWRKAKRRILGVGKPLLLGLAIMSTVIGLTTYVVVSAAWRLAVLWKRRRRRRRA